RPLYVVSSDGTLHSIRPSDGADMAPARKFVPAGTNVSSLNVAGGFVYAAISAGCDRAPAGLWAMNVNDPVAKPVFFPAKSADPGASIGTGGTVYSAAPDGIVSLTAGELAVRQKFSRPAPVSTAPVAFLWKGREWIAGAGPQGVFLLDPTRPAFIDRVPGRGLTGSLATAEDAHGARWLYAAAQGGILAFKLAAAGELPKLSSVWTSANLPAPTSPVVANGIVFTLSTGGTPSLRALDALTGKQLYSSGDALKSSTARSNLAVANGHICFGGADGTLYCFGIPFEI
ncbi:MAG TPA: PQQ-binding-like beta-propeller repeat protein, partial [Bryobacteraceae bacterium]|nr:PQQ-binding-like beta-propeller repeat protein [Bryobacteraceae bacterium]